MTRWGIWLALASAAVAAPGCGVIDDPNPEEIRVRIHLAPGETYRGSIHMLDGEEMAEDFLSWDERVRHLPAGFELDTKRLLRHGAGVDADYFLTVPPDAAPGRYHFKVVYELFSLALLREQVDVRFVVTVREDTVDEDEDEHEHED